MPINLIYGHVQLLYIVLLVEKLYMQQKVHFSKEYCDKEHSTSKVLVVTEGHCTALPWRATSLALLDCEREKHGEGGATSLTP